MHSNLVGTHIFVSAIGRALVMKDVAFFDHLGRLAAIFTVLIRWIMQVSSRPVIH